MIQMWVTGDGAEEELRSFYKWLLDEQAVRQHATITLEPGKIERDAMGGSLELIQLIVDSGFQMANLALAYVAWHSTRRRSSELTVERGDTVVKLSGANADDAEQVLRSLEAD